VCDVPARDLKISPIKRPRPNRAVPATKKKLIFLINRILLKIAKFWEIFVIGRHWSFGVTFFSPL
jgi:hypothetical protein